MNLGKRSPWRAPGYALAGAALVVACGGSDPPVTGGTTPPGTTPPGTGTTPPPPPPDDSFGISSIKPAANDASFVSPFDAAPDPKGENVYFTALTPEGEPAVFVVAAAGGAPKVLHKGAPLASPFGIAISPDGKTLYVADGSSPKANGDEDGAVLTLPTGGGAPSVLGGSAGKNPRGVDVAGDFVYYTGRVGASSGVFKAPLAGGEPTLVLSGAPLKEPAGIAVTSKGEVYVVDAFAEGVVGAAIFLVGDGKATLVKDGFAVGHPAGLALSLDQTSLYLSGVDRKKLTNVVYRVKLADATTKTFTDVVGAFKEGAGLHRAATADVYAWADSRANNTGTVYVLRK